MIPFVDLHRQYISIKEEIDNAINDVIQNTAFIGGKKIADFEEDFAKWLGIKFCVGCANGTDSIEILLQSMGIGVGDEVIVPAVSWISTSEAVSSIGATPIFVDIDPITYTIDIDKIEVAITNKTKAIIPVHLYGHPADMLTIMTIAKKHNLKVLEDCAQAHGASINGQYVGTFGDAASFSFYPGKNLGAYGDAGGMVTNNVEIAKKARQISNHGQEGKHNHLIEGRNSRLDGLQAAILNVKLPYLSKWVKDRNEVGKNYLKSINTSKIGLPSVNEGCVHAWHLFVIQSENRDQLKKYLLENGVESAIHYPTALPFLKCYENGNFKASDYPIAFEFTKKILSIPMFPELNKDEQDNVINLLNNFND